MSIYRELFYTKGKNNYAPKYEPQDPSTWPKEWVATYYKQYPRMPKIVLPNETATFDLFSALASRTSDRVFSRQPLTLSELAKILKYSCGQFTSQTENETRTRRAYPSGGARYPIEVYALVFFGTTELPKGVYHYNVKEHLLEEVPYDRKLFAEPAKLVISDWSANASVMLVMTGVFWRSEVKYQERGSWYTFLEAGHIGQNIHLVSKALGLKSVGLGGVWDDNLEKLLVLDTPREVPIHSVVIGK